MEQEKKADYHIHISSEHRLLELNLKEVWCYRDLILLFTKRHFTVAYKQTILGPVWLFLNPLISAVIYAFVFGGIAGIGTEGVPELLFYLCGNAVWIYFSSCVTRNAGTFTGNAGVFGKVYFPRLTVPLSNVLSSMLQFGIRMIMVMVLLVFFLIRGEVQPNWWAWLLIPVELVHLGLLGLGFGIMISSLTTKYRDLSILVGFGVQLWMYVTPIVYPMSALGDGFIRRVLLINPVTAPVELLRFAILGQGTSMPGYLALSAGITLAVVFGGILIFNKVERTFMDTV